ncbi:2-polyprenyl-6-methoxyphenol hydroxylase-like oxidoreductase [Streptomyces mobaraensis NBRC 13819 = DSM 40847]|uniref:2-polyprenyl-6-methoxyphenol hydroxylase-like oxidoreductase n=1 Tax=Streptomyces mobaraensis (strain ATCC 29032 / DSM 40847 / JCM 4168 / NBRC 13819 / NCIMB 11159 / IPCR 16-22) TaxID=1223523 RepID=M3CCM1_STRM1|nr:2-polyprenyl-6-methoxyphenol hydroxylase-like oxidoreductase [Streptomyces mobaraensis NBRC 13819 = DSM 40847]
MPVPDDAGTETDVLIVGAGPVGLTARALLERWGVRTLLVERHRALSPFPRSRLVNVRSIEIFRGLGTAAGITDVAFPPEYGRIRFRDTLDGPDFASAAMAGIDARVPESPVRGVVSSQDRLEPLLLGAAGSPVRFGTELTALTEDDEGVEALLADRGGGAGTRVRARHVLAADGAHSTVRRLLGIGTTGPGALGDITTVVFDADLGRWCADRPAGVYFTAHGSFLPLYPEGGWSWFAPTPDDPEHADWAAIVARALGPGVQAGVEVLRVQQWVMRAFVAEEFRHGRVLLAGDAAHAMPIIGGLGMNTGVADAHNLCWKLAGVIQGWACPSLLDTYAAERRPVAQRTLRQTVANTRLLQQVQQHRRERITSGETTPKEAEVPWSEQYFAQLGLVLGAAYRSAAVLTGHATHPNRPIAARITFPRRSRATACRTAGSPPDAPPSTRSASGSPSSPRTPPAGRRGPRPPRPGRCVSSPFRTSTSGRTASARTAPCSSGPTATSAPDGTTRRPTATPSAAPSPRSPAWHPADGPGTGRAYRCQDRHSRAYVPSAATSSSWLPSSLIRPSSATAITSASWAVCSRWAMATTVRPSSTLARELSRRRAARGSSRDVASSSTRVCGSARTSRASAICWAWAGVRARPPEPTSVSSPFSSARAHSSASTTFSAAHSSSSPAPDRASSRLSRSEPTKTWCSWLTSATCRRTRSVGIRDSSAPPRVTVPEPGA